MAMSTCVKCGGHTFEIQENEPIDSRFKFMFIQCASCGGVVGVVDYYNIGNIVTKIANKIGAN